jgi:hypothetical protein
MKLVVRQVSELTQLEYRSCYQLNLRSNGLMRDRLVNCKTYNTGYVVMLQDDEGVLLSWALVFNWDRDKDLYGAYFYTRKSARRRGLGNQIAGEVRKQFKNIVVWPSDNQGKTFFDKHKFKVRLTYWCG